MPERVKDDKMTSEELEQWILRQLGAPTWKVELTEDQLKDSIYNARRWFSAKKGAKAFVTLSVIPGETEYNLPDDVDTVLNVAFWDSNLELTEIFAPWSEFDERVPYNVFASHGLTGGLYSYYLQTIQYTNMAKLIVGSEDDWFQAGRKLYIMPRPSAGETMIIGAKMNCMRIEKLDERDHDLVKRFALAWAMRILARVRRKYGASFPGAQGEFGLDAAELMDEARDEFEKLEEEISLSGFPMGFMVG